MYKHKHAVYIIIIRDYITPMFKINYSFTKSKFTNLLLAVFSVYTCLCIHKDIDTNAYNLHSCEYAPMRTGLKKGSLPHLWP